MFVILKPSERVTSFFLLLVAAEESNFVLVLTSRNADTITYVLIQIQLTRHLFKQSNLINSSSLKIKQFRNPPYNK